MNPTNPWWRHTFEKNQMLLMVPSIIIRLQSFLIISICAPSVQNSIQYSMALWATQIQWFTILSSVTLNYCHLNFDVLKSYSEEKLTLTHIQSRQMLWSKMKLKFIPNRWICTFCHFALRIHLIALNASGFRMFSFLNHFDNCRFQFKF